MEVTSFDKWCSVVEWYCVKVILGDSWNMYEVRFCPPAWATAVYDMHCISFCPTCLTSDSAVLVWFHRKSPREKSALPWWEHTTLKSDETNVKSTFQTQIKFKLVLSKSPPSWKWYLCWRQSLFLHIVGPPPPHPPPPPPPFKLGEFQSMVSSSSHGLGSKWTFTHLYRI